MTNTNVDFDKLIQEAEFQQYLLAAQSQFQRNLLYFDEVAPELAEAFRHYQPARIHLRFHQGHWDLIDTSINKPIYDQDPVTYADSSVSKFLRTPFCYRVSLLPSAGLGTESEAHIGNINPMHGLLDDAIEAHPEPRKPPIGSNCRFIIVNGIGLGYHLKKLIDRTCIQHLCIIEPDADIIFAALHTIDWREICEVFESDGRSINLVLTQTPEAGANQLAEHVNTIGIFNCTRTYVFSHLKNTVLQKTIDNFIAQLTIKVGGLGYFDDERIGLAHTIENTRRGASLLDLKKAYPSKLKKAKLEQLPAIIVANGPSLDLAKQMLEHNRDRAIIISCGTALGSLYQLGIKPDFHVEMERTRPVLEWIETSTDAEFRKNIILLALNTVHPEVFNYFDQTAVALKTNDVGSLYLLERLGRLAFNAHLNRCNPTVGNTGLSFAIALGFESIYLVGLDLGFAATGQHHSRYSAHYRIKEQDVDSLDLRTADKDGILKLPGNFGGEIVVTSVYSSARINAQKLLTNHPAVTCYNTSDGVFIEGTKPCPVDQVELPTGQWDKSEFVDILMKNYKFPDLRKSIPGNKEIDAYFSEIKNTFIKLVKIVEKPVASTAEAWNILQYLYDETLKLKNASQYGSVHCLVKGSIDAFSLVLARSLFIQADESEIIAIYTNLKSYFVKFLHHSVELLETTLFELDERKRNLVEKYKASPDC